MFTFVDAWFTSIVLVYKIKAVQARKYAPNNSCCLWSCFLAMFLDNSSS